MAKGKGRGARDLLYGRQGGHWVDQGHAPGEGLADIEKIRRRTKAAHERDAEKNPAWPDLERLADLAGFTPTTPEEWAGRARMAGARLRAGVELDWADHEALARTERRSA